MTRATFFILALITVLNSSCGYKIYVVRHAEKQVSTDPDPLLTDLGTQRAIALKDSLRNKKIRYFFSTNTKRTTNTAAPTAAYFKKPIRVYQAKIDSGFYGNILKLKKNTLIVGHSNTIDDIVNGLMGEKVIPGDFKDWEYDNLFIIRVRGKKKTFVAKKYGPRIIIN